MPYNYKGDLYKREVVKKLQDMGLDVKSVNALNKIMEKMGLLIHYGNGWGTTDAGAKFSMWHKGIRSKDALKAHLMTVSSSRAAIISSGIFSPQARSTTCTGPESTL